MPSDFSDAWCPGLSDHHIHSGKSEGFDADGHFLTRRLQTYPPLLCEVIASMMVKSLQLMKLRGTGPSGFMRPSGTPAPLSAWSSKPGGDLDFGVSILNEVGELRSRCVVSENQAGVYLHVDDTVVITAAQSKLHADDLMVAFAESMEEVGFIVPERMKSEHIVKVVGFEVDQRRALFKFPAKKAWLLRNTLKYMARQSFVDVDLLRAVVGIYMHGAQLNRDLMTIPFVIYHMIERCEGEVVRMWPSVRRELQAMSSAVVFMQCQVSRTFSDVVWASDAQGAGEGDLGGFGVVCTKVSESELRALRESGETLGRSVARLDGTLSGVKNPYKPLVPTVPYTLLPESLFDLDRWCEVEAGRWSFQDHITLGELRGVLKIVERLAANVGAHEKVHFSLQDNQVCAATMSKGRSASWPIMFLLRKKASLCLASALRLILPWVESKRMPADEISRRQ